MSLAVSLFLSFNINLRFVILNHNTISTHIILSVSSCVSHEHHERSVMATTSRILLLPAELRLRIYGFVFDNCRVNLTREVVSIDGRRPQKATPNSPVDEKDAEYSPQNGLPHTCKHICFETTDFIDRNCLFTTEPPAEGYYPVTTSFTTRLSSQMGFESDISLWAIISIYSCSPCTVPLLPS